MSLCKTFISKLKTFHGSKHVASKCRIDPTVCKMSEYSPSRDKIVFHLKTTQQFIYSYFTSRIKSEC